MAEGFEERVKRLFGSNLIEPGSKSSSPLSLWSVADGEVQRREWNRERGLGHEREDDPCSSSFYGKDGFLLKNRTSKRDKQREFEGALDDLDDLGGDDDDEEEERESGGGDDEEREIRSSIGCDPTLDNEEEEDEYDKAAVCKEIPSEYVYMRDVKDHSSYIKYHPLVPDFDDPSDESNYFSKDPRADHFAASARLKEDKSTAVDGSSVKITENDVSPPKPILKRKEPRIEPKPKKRVRFDHNEDYEEPQDFPAVTRSMETPISEESTGIPDYLRNPSKYTHYTFDSSEDNEEETNRRAFEDFRNLVNGSKPDEFEFPAELPKSVTFTPRKKSTDAVQMNDSPMNHNVSGCSVASESDACDMDEDDAEGVSADVNMSSRRSRRYRERLSMTE